MLECYLDDSGTHGGSKVVVWGGVLGHKDYLAQLDSAWREQLKEPCEGKPPIKKFSSANLLAGAGEFEGYSEGEKDWTRRNFRKLILDCELTVISFGASVRDWEQVIQKLYGMASLTAEQSVFSEAVREVLKCAVENNEPVSFQFDQGRHSNQLDMALGAAMDSEEFDHLIVNYGFSKVGAMPALQAADLVAHESYRFFVDRLRDKKARLNLHTERLFADAFDSKGGWSGRREIKAAAKKTAHALRAIKRGAG